MSRNASRFLTRVCHRNAARHPQPDILSGNIAVVQVRIGLQQMASEQPGGSHASGSGTAAQQQLTDEELEIQMAIALSLQEV
jgi:hypothetical protein